MYMYIFRRVEGVLDHVIPNNAQYRFIIGQAISRMNTCTLIIAILVRSFCFSYIKQDSDGPVSLMIFARNSNSIKTSPCCNSLAGHRIATNFCKCHDSTAVAPCTQFCSDHCIRIEMRVKRKFHRIWIAMGNRQWNGAHVYISNIPNRES